MQDSYNTYVNSKTRISPKLSYFITTRKQGTIATYMRDDIQPCVKKSNIKALNMILAFKK